jgi:hypothetical protein
MFVSKIHEYFSLPIEIFSIEASWTLGYRILTEFL